jgi:hypothetical protein
MTDLRLEHLACKTTAQLQAGVSVQPGKAFKLCITALPVGFLYGVMPHMQPCMQ